MAYTDTHPTSMEFCLWEKFIMEPIFFISKQPRTINFPDIISVSNMGFFLKVTRKNTTLFPQSESEYSDDQMKQNLLVYKETSLSSSR